MRFLLDFFLPHTCCACANIVDDVRFLCAECWEKTDFMSAACPTCAQPLKVSHGTPRPCSYCQRMDWHFDGVLAISTYKSVMRDLIGRLKNGSATDLIPFLSFLMAGKIKEAQKDTWENIDIMLPVPMHWWRLMTRGYNQSALLCRGIQAHIPIPMDLDLLRKIQTTRPQSSLSRQERLFNLKNSFALNAQKNIEGKNCLLVDDVTTTLSTLNTCAHELKKAGASRVFCIVLAKTPFLK